MKKILPLVLICSAFALAGCEWVSEHDTSPKATGFSTNPGTSIINSEESLPESSDIEESHQTGLSSTEEASNQTGLSSEEGPISHDTDLSGQEESHATGLSTQEESHNSGLSSLEPAKITYTIVDCPSWWGSDGVALFASAWDYNDVAGWYAVTLNNGVASFEVDVEMKGALLVRCYEGTTVPNWSITTGDVDGRIYNQTEDINFSIGIYSYSCPDYMDYPH